MGVNATTRRHRPPKVERLVSLGPEDENRGSRRACTEYNDSGIEVWGMVPRANLGDSWKHRFKVHPESPVKR
jgi:hypothetical protein